MSHTGQLQWESFQPQTRDENTILTASLILPKNELQEDVDVNLPSDSQRDNIEDQNVTEEKTNSEIETSHKSEKESSEIFVEIVDALVISGIRIVRVKDVLAQSSSLTDRWKGAESSFPQEVAEKLELFRLAEAKEEPKREVLHFQFEDFLSLSSSIQLYHNGYHFKHSELFVGSSEQMDIPFLCKFQKLLTWRCQHTQRDENLTLSLLRGFGLLGGALCG